jgi:hypothetical protein
MSGGTRRHTTTSLVAVATAVAVGATVAALAVPATADGSSGRGPDQGSSRARVDVIAPREGDTVGFNGRAWPIDLSVTYRGEDALAMSGFTAAQLTGPGVHTNAPPFPGAFAPGRDEALPGLVVLVSSWTPNPGTNLAGLFNLTSVQDRTDRSATIWDSWIVGGPNATPGPGTIYAAVVDDLDGNGVFDDAPATIADADGDGDVDAADLRAVGLAGPVTSVRFTLSAAPLG